MSALSEHVEEYLRARRALGVKLERAGRLLPQLVGYLEAARREHGHARAGDLVGQAPRRRSPPALGGEAVDRARVCRLPADDRPEHRDPAGRGVRRPLPAPDPIPVVPAGHRPTARSCADELHPPLKAASYEALFGLLAVTGMRLGEAIALEPGDVDLDDGRDHDPPGDGQARARPAGPAAPDHGAGARALRQNPSAVVPRAEIGDVLPLQRRHPPGSQRSRKDAAHADHHARPADRHRPPDRAPAQTQLRCQHPDRLAAPRCSDRRADRRALDLSRACQPSRELLVSDRHPGADGQRRRSGSSGTSEDRP